IHLDKTIRRGTSGDYVQGPVTAHVGDTLGYRFEVTNTGDTPLTVSFSDPKCDTGTLSGPTGDTNGDGKLDVTETWVYTCTHVLKTTDLDQNGRFQNTATATGTDSLGGSAQDTDSATAQEIHRGININKTIRRGSTGDYVQGPILAHLGDTLCYRFVVTNTGNTPLTVVFSDPKCDSGTLSGPTGDSNGVGKLDVTETWVHTCTHVLKTTDLDENGQFQNTATATGTDSLG